MNNRQHATIFYTLFLLFGYNLVCFCASDIPITLRFIAHPEQREAHLIIGEEFMRGRIVAILRKDTVLARIAFRIAEPSKLFNIIEIAGQRYTAMNKDPEILIQQAVKQHPNINPNAISILRQFFKEFNSSKQIKKGLQWQGNLRFKELLSEEIFKKVDGELDQVLDYEEELSHEGLNESLCIKEQAP